MSTVNLQSIDLNKTNYENLKKGSIIAFIIAFIATAYDAFSSWKIIAIDKIAIEANGIWNIVANEVGFDGAMIIRFLFGAILLTVLFLVSFYSKKPRARKLARIGLYIIATVLLLLCCYHVYGTLTVSMYLS